MLSGIINKNGEDKKQRYKININRLYLFNNKNICKKIPLNRLKFYI
jgi:hypothetical protein